MITERIIQEARTQLLAAGEYTPSLVVETDKGIDLVVVAGMPPMGPERQFYFFGMGRRIGRSHQGEALRTVTLISETWVSRGRDDGTRRYAKPEDDPERGESLMLVQMDLTCTPPAQDGIFLDMHRDAAGKLVDAVPRRFDGKMTMNLIYRFIAGWESAAMSDADILRMMLNNTDTLH